VAGVERPGQEEPRERVLDEQELIALWRACEGDEPYGSALRLLLLTGCRRDEVSRMRRSELAYGDQVWAIPGERTKSAKPHTVPLSRQARCIVAAMPAINDSDFVFVTARGGNGIAGGWAKAKERISERAGIDPKTWRLHDLRRTAASGLQRLGTRAEVIERALGHASGLYRGVAGVYQVDPLLPEVEVALQRWADHLEQLVERRPAKATKVREKVLV
jgi:integrase